jgi:hypothetical protein
MDNDNDLMRIRLEVTRASLEDDIDTFQIAYLKLEGTMMRIAREVWETRPRPRQQNTRARKLELWPNLGDAPDQAAFCAQPSDHAKYNDQRS